MKFIEWLKKLDKKIIRISNIIAGRCPYASECKNYQMNGMTCREGGDYCGTFRELNK